jgi:hypothetical protein
LSVPRLIAVTPGDAEYNLRDAITTLGAHGWPAIILREPNRTAAENNTLMQLAHDVGIQMVICHEKSPHTRPTSAIHAGEGWSGDSRAERVGVSCHNADQVENALSAGADYTLLSPLFSPTSKPLDERTPLGIQRFLRIAKDQPVLALGGVNTENYAQILAAGVYGVAIMGSIFNEPETASKFLSIYRNQKINNSSS